MKLRNEHAPAAGLKARAHRPLGSLAPSKRAPQGRLPPVLTDSLPDSRAKVACQEHLSLGVARTRAMSRTSPIRTER
jgi:hypothetical protein